MASQLEKSLNNTTIKSLFCNHCMFDCVSLDLMKDHYRSEFHKYNLNRVTNNLNPLILEEFTAKREAFVKLNILKKEKLEEEARKIPTNLSCDCCRKTFASGNKMTEHLKTKVHIANSKKFEENQKKISTNTPVEKNESGLNTMEDITVCLFCNAKNESLEHNIFHMLEMHKLEIPIRQAVKNAKGFLKILADKVFKYKACIFCDKQNFESTRSLQSHMIDTRHTKINTLDMEEFLYKYYDLKELLKIKDRFVKKTKEYEILKFKLMLKEKKKNKRNVKEIKEINEDEEEWGTDSDEEKEKDELVDTKKQKNKKENSLDTEDELEDESAGPIVLPNGELLLESGITVGHKMYKTYYAQRHSIKKFDDMATNLTRLRNNAERKIRFKKERKINNCIKYKVVKESNNSAFIRINTLFKARKQVNV